MGISNYRTSLWLKSTKPFMEISEFHIFEDIVTFHNEDEVHFHISSELGYLFHSAEQFNRTFKNEYGRTEYSEILSKETLKKLGTLQDAKPWFESNELTAIDSMDGDFSVLDPNKVHLFLLDLKRYLDGFYWHTDKPKLFRKLDEVNLLILISKFCLRNNIKIKMIEIG